MEHLLLNPYLPYRSSSLSYIFVFTFSWELHSLRTSEEFLDLFWRFRESQDLGGGRCDGIGDFVLRRWNLQRLGGLLF